MVEISIIIVNYNSVQQTCECVKSIIKSDFNGLEFEIIVVDNNSSESIHKIHQFEKNNVQIIQSKTNTGMGAANNQGAKVAKGTFLLISNPDIIFASNTIFELYSAIANDQTIGIIGPRLVHENGELNHSCYTFPGLCTPLFRRSFLGRIFRSHVDRFLMKDKDLTVPQDVDWLLGACFLIKKTLFEAIGGFDRRFFLYFEDVDLCKKVKLKKLKAWYLPSVECVHKHKRASAQRIFVFIPFNRLTLIHLISWIKYLKKWHFPGLRFSRARPEMLAD